MVVSGIVKNAGNLYSFSFLWRHQLLWCGILTAGYTYPTDEFLLSWDMSTTMVLIIIMAMIFLLVAVRMGAYRIDYLPILIPVLIELNVNLTWFGIWSRLIYKLHGSVHRSPSRHIFLKELSRNGISKISISA